MQQTEAQQLLLEILDYAKVHNSISFCYITSWQEFKYYRQQARATKVIVRILEDSFNNLFKSYCKDVIAGISDVNKILACVQLRNAIAFYKKELSTLQRMLDDYDDYLDQGNFWHSFLGGERKYYSQEDKDIWNMY